MSEAEEYVEEEITKFTVDTFDGQEDSTYKYIHIDKAREIALVAVSMARKEEIDSLERLADCLKNYSCGKHIILTGAIRKMIDNKKRFLSVGVEV